MTPVIDNTMTTVIDIEDLRFRWPGTAQDVLDIRAWQVAAGEHVFVHGPSGCGKSTLLSLIGAVQVPDHGSLRVLGQPLERLGGAQRDRFRSDHLGFIFQQFNLIPYLSVIENVLLPVRFSARRAAQTAQTAQTALPVQTVQAANEAYRLLRALDLPADLDAQAARLLSVGQQQRVAAARALIGRPELIIADEPTSSLDAQRQQVFLDLLAAECRAAHSTLIFVSHDSRLASRFDRLVSLPELNRARPAGDARQ